MNKKEFTIEGRKFRCVSYYGYNSHYYVTVFDITDGGPRYMGQINDLEFGHSNFMSRLTEFVKVNAF